MKKANKRTNVSSISIVFYVVAVLFLIIAAFTVYQAYTTVEAYKAKYIMTFLDIANIYITTCCQYFAYAFITYGIGVIISRIMNTNDSLETILDSAIEEVVDEDRDVVEVLATANEETTNVANDTSKDAKDETKPSDEVCEDVKEADTKKEVEKAEHKETAPNEKESEKKEKVEDKEQKK